MESYISIHGIQNEQKKIIEIEKELKMLVTKINQSINCLQVEELQLKSVQAKDIISSYKSQKCESVTHQSEEEDENKTHLVELKCSPANFENADGSSSYDEYKMFDDPTLINKQLLNLDIAPK